MRCPKCRRADGLNSVEKVYHHIPFRADDASGEIDFDASQVFWDTTENQYNERREPLIHCSHCDHEWHSRALKGRI